MIEVQNGSIDLVIGIDLKVANGLSGLFKIAFAAYGAYLTHKKLLIPITAGFFNNPKLLQKEDEIEALMLENIEDAVKAEAATQSKAASQAGAKVDNAAKVIEQISRLITRHVLRGNDVKLLALPGESEATKPALVEASRLANELRKESTTARNAAKGLPPALMEMLLQHYAEPRESESPVAQSAPEAKPRKKKDTHA